jgi:hypothetical protein
MIIKILFTIQLTASNSVCFKMSLKNERINCLFKKTIAKAVNRAIGREIVKQHVVFFILKGNCMLRLSAGGTFKSALQNKIEVEGWRQWTNSINVLFCGSQKAMDAR